MNKYMKIALLSLALIVGASANDGSKQTVVRFSAPVEAPGVILPAGNYVFRLAGDESNRDLIEIFKEEEDEPMATLTTIPTSRSSVTEGVALMFEQKPDGRPEALRQLFYPGEIEGVEFVYEARPVTADGDQGDDSDGGNDDVPQVVKNTLGRALQEQPLNVIVIPLPDETGAEAGVASEN
jgi:hypothetical protein